MNQLGQSDFAPERGFSRRGNDRSWRALSQRTWQLITLGLTLMLGLTFPPAAQALAGDRIMVYGDSLSASYGIDPKLGWVSLLQAKLKADGVSVVNSSISGETTSGGVSRIKTDLERIKPTVVILALGANDGLRGLPIASTRKNLQSMITAILASKARVVLVGIQIPPNYGIEYAQQFSMLYPELARLNKLAAPPFLLEGFAEKLDQFQADRLHPSAAAQPQILNNVLPAIAGALAGKSVKPDAATRQPLMR